MLQEQGSHLSHAEGWAGEKPFFSHLCDDSFQRKQGGGKELSGPCWVQEGSVVVAPIFLNEQNPTSFFCFVFSLIFSCSGITVKEHDQKQGQVHHAGTLCG